MLELTKRKSSSRPIKPHCKIYCLVTEAAVAPRNSLREFYEAHVDAWRTPRDRREFRRTLILLNAFLKREPELSDLTVATVSNFENWLVARGLSLRSACNKRKELRSCWLLARREGKVTTRPCRVRCPVPPPEPVPLPQGGDPRTLLEFFENTYAPLRLRGKSPTTSFQYRVQLRHFARFLGREAVLGDLDDETFSRFLSWVSTGRAAPTVNKCRQHLLALWRLAARKRLVENFPDVPASTEPARIPRAWQRADLDCLWAALAAQKGTIDGVPAGAWWIALHQVLWWSGERIGAVRQLRWDDVDLGSGWLTIRAEYRKFRLSDKATQLPGPAVDSLRAILLPAREMVFPWSYAPASLYNRYTAILKRAGLPHDRKSKFHRMRKSAASHFEAAGGNATELLGHSNRKVTRNYLDPRITKPPQAAELLFAPSAGEGQR